MTISVTPTEHTILLDFLERLSDYQSVAGCNDYAVPATRESRDLIKAAYLADGRDPSASDAWVSHDGKFHVIDFVLLDYLRRKIEGATDCEGSA